MIFLHKKRDLKFLKIILIKEKSYTGFKASTAIHMCDISCEGAEDSENLTRRYQCSYGLLSHEQPSAIGGLRQTQSNLMIHA